MPAPGHWHADYQPPSERPQSPDWLAASISWLTGFLFGWFESLFAPAEERRRRSLQRWTRQWQQHVLQLARESESPDAAARSLAALRQMLVGRNRAYIVETLGPPPAISPSAARVSGAQQRPHYWHAEVWYYPLDIRRRRAVAFAFENDRVRSIEHLTGPG